MRIQTMVAALALLFIMTAAASAQVYAPTEATHGGSNTPVTADTKGFHLGLGLNGSAIKSDNSDTESGGGFHFRIGYGITRNVTLFFGGAGASMNDAEYSMGQADLGIRGYFPGNGRWVPFVEGAFTGRALVMDVGYNDNLEFTGAGFTAGGGVDYYVSRSLGIGVNLNWTFGEFTDAKMGSEKASLGSDAFSATSTRFNIGLTWWP
jgi:hypothetical protein